MAYMKLFGRQQHQTKDTSVSSEEKGRSVTPIRVTSHDRLILRPLVTEKSAYLTSLGKYAFEVAPNANRIAVQQAIASRYGVRPIAVHLQNVRGETVRFGRHLGKQKSWKKAIVTLPKGQKIDVHEGV